MEINAIVAIDKNKAIGKDGKLPWYLPSELKHFKNLTIGYPMVLGRTTYDSFKKPLPSRDHLVLSNRELTTQFENVFGFKTKEALLQFCQERNYSKIFICGGQSIYQLFEQEISHWHVSEIQCEIQGADTHLKNTFSKGFQKEVEEKFFDEVAQIQWIYQSYRRCK